MTESPRYDPEDFIADNIHIDKNGRVWSLDPTDKSYYNATSKTYCIYLELTPCVELQTPVINVNARENMVQEVIEAIERRQARR